MATLRVRAYNVRFGDAILVTVPDKNPSTGKETTRHILIDVGNVLSGVGGPDDVFKPAIDDIITELGGKPLDLYVMTHEHLDHIQGLFYVDSRVYPNGDFAKKFSVNYAWITASAAEDYYDKHPDAKKKKELYLDTYEAIARHLAARPEAATEPFRSWLLNNDPRSTGECVAYLRALAKAKKTTYVYRGVNLRGRHPFKEAKFSIWAPEEDTSEYYGRFQPMSLGAASSSAAGGNATATNGASAEPRPPAGVDAGAFLQLVEARRRGFADNLLAIDQAANNTSVVFSLEWRGWHLLFSGDAEIRSWRTMEKHGVLSPVHFLKVAHHGSHNGTPEGDIFDAILPEHPADNRDRVALISTYKDTYGGIPHAATNTRLRKRCKLYSTLTSTTKPYIDVTFDG